METNTRENENDTVRDKSLGGLSRLEAVLAIVAVALLALGCLAVLRPFVSAILWALVLAYSTWPLLLRLERRLRGRRSVAAAIMVLLITLIMVLPFVAVGVTRLKTYRESRICSGSCKGVCRLWRPSG